MADIKPLTSALAALVSAAMRRGRAWWLRRAGEALVVIAFLHATVFGCIPAFELEVPSPIFILFRRAPRP